MLVYDGVGKYTYSAENGDITVTKEDILNMVKLLEQKEELCYVEKFPYSEVELTEYTKEDILNMVELEDIDEMSGIVGDLIDECIESSKDTALEYYTTKYILIEK